TVRSLRKLLPTLFASPLTTHPPSVAYNFLDPTIQHAKLAAWIIGICVGQAIIFSIIKGVMYLRQRWAVKHLRVLQVQHGIEAFSDDDDWEEVTRPPMSA